MCDTSCFSFLFHFFLFGLHEFLLICYSFYRFHQFSLWHLIEGEYDFTMRIFNSDGSEPEMCGNGIRCLAQFLKDLGEDGACRCFYIFAVLITELNFLVFTT